MNLESLTVLFPFMGSGLGGSHVAALRLINGLRADSRCHCIVIAPEGSLLEVECATQGIEFLPSGEAAVAHNEVSSFEAMRMLRRSNIIKRFVDRGPTIIHCNDLRTQLAWGVPAKLASIPVVYHHRAIHQFGLVKRKIVSLADYIVTVSEGCTENISFVHSGKRQQVLDPIEVEFTDPKSSLKEGFHREFGIPPEAMIVGFVGNFWKRKRPDYFLRTCSVLAHRMPNVWFALFGGEGDYSILNLQKLAESLGVKHNTVFAGFRTPAGNNMQILDALAAPALGEPFGLTLLEAIICGVPYVATGDGGHAESFRRWKGGDIVAKEASPDEFAKALVKVLSAPGDWSLGNAERAKIQVDASPIVHARQLGAVYKNVM